MCIFVFNIISVCVLKNIEICVYVCDFMNCQRELLLPIFKIISKIYETNTVASIQTILLLKLHWFTVVLLP